MNKLGIFLIISAGAIMRGADQGGSAGGGKSGEITMVQRKRQPFAAAVDADETSRRLRHAEAAAKTLEAQEDARQIEAKALGHKYERRATPTAAQLLKEAMSATVEDPQPDPLPLKGAGECIGATYIPTIEEIAAAGYPNPEAVRARVITEANHAEAAKAAATTETANADTKAAPTA